MSKQVSSTPQAVEMQPKRQDPTLENWFKQLDLGVADLKDSMAQHILLSADLRKVSLDPPIKISIAQKSAILITTIIAMLETAGVQKSILRRAMKGVEDIVLYPDGKK